MREIIFRGRRKDNGEWVEGSLFAEGTRVEIVRGTCNNVGIEGVDVIPETVGQYTGLTDKNGNKIFEGDILMFGLSPRVVKWDTPNARYMLYENGVYLKNGFNVDSVALKEVIGNVHDNPELLGDK